MDRETEKPISGACVTEVLNKGRFLDAARQIPDRFSLLGSRKFRIPANPRRVMNASDPESHPYFSVSADGYHNSWFIPTSEVLSGGKITISLVHGGDLSN